MAQIGPKWSKMGPRKGIKHSNPEILVLSTSLFTNPTGLPDVLLKRNSKTHGFYVVPCFPSLSSPTRGSPRLEITRKCCSKSLVKRSFETAAGQKRIRTMARWPGFGGACPTGDPATELPSRKRRHGRERSVASGMNSALGFRLRFTRPSVYRR